MLKPDCALSSNRLQRASFATRGFFISKTQNTEIVENGGNAQTSGTGHISEGWMRLCFKERERGWKCSSSGIWVRALCCSSVSLWLLVAHCKDSVCLRISYETNLTGRASLRRSGTHIPTVYCNMQTAIGIKILLHILAHVYTMLSPGDDLLRYRTNEAKSPIRLWDDERASWGRLFLPRKYAPPLSSHDLLPLEHHKRDSHSQQQHWFLLSLKFQLPIGVSFAWHLHE